MEVLNGHKKTLVLVFIIAFTVRLLYVIQVRDNPLYTTLMFDSETYDKLAVDALKNGLLSGEVYFIGPLYVFFLYGVYLTFGHSLLAVMITQALLDSVTCVLAYIIGVALFDRRVGLTAGIITALYGPQVFYTATLLTETLLVFLNTLLVLLLIKSYKEDEPLFWFTSGIVMGLSSLGKPNILLLLPVILALRLSIPYKKGDSRNSFLLIAGVILAVSPAMLRNLALGSLTPITANAGYNFFIGNNPDATGMFIPITELASSSGRSVYIQTRLFKPDAAGMVNSWQAEILWFSKSVEYIIKDPTRYILLVFKKTMLYLNSHEIPQVYNYNFLRNGSVIRLLIPSMALIAPLGMLGMVLNAWNKKTLPASLYIIAYSASIILFFITARYRIPVMPVLTVFAADAAWYLIEKAGTDRKALKSKSVSLLILVLIVNNPFYNTSELEMTGMLNPYNNLGMAYAKKGELDKAVGAYMKAVELSPYQYEAYNNLGAAYNSLGEYDNAEEVLKKALKINNVNAYAHNNLGTTYYNKGLLLEAKTEYLRAVEINPYYYEAHNNLGGIYMALNQSNDAVIELQIASQLNPYDATTRYNLGVAYLNLGYHSKGLRELKTASELDDSYVGEYENALDLFNGG